ncbi:MAG: hypothetical protein IT337_12860, partial [Thermomicrobiales bacterium]|nr:hypothetical protein [Thermomicrobiales bacterium]
AWWIATQQIACHLRTVIATLRASVRLPDTSTFAVRGFEHIHPLLNHRGIVLVAPHAGPYTILGIIGRMWLAELGFTGELVVVARMFQPLRSRAVMEWFTASLARTGISIVSVDEQPLRLAARLRTTLENNGIVVLLVDEPTPTPSLDAPFFDSTIRMPIGPARLAYSTGAALLPVMAAYARGGKHLIRIAEPIEPSPDPAVSLAQVGRALESLIARNLGQWSMLTPVWADAVRPLPARYAAADLHVHTPGSDGLCAIEEWRDAARSAGLRVIAVTDHDHLATVRDWVVANPDRGDGDVAVIPGVELTARGRIVHLGVLFPEVIPERLPKPGTPLPELIRWARAIPGSIVVLVHPHPGLWRRQLRGLARQGLLPDAIETRYPLVGWQARQLERAAAAYGLAVLGGTDAHLVPGQIGRFHTIFAGETADDLVRAIRSRSTRAASAPAVVGVPLRVYALQSIYSWLLPFRSLPGVANWRAGLLRRAQQAARAANPKPVGLATLERERERPRRRVA